MDKAQVRQRVIHEVNEFFIVVLFLLPFLASFAAYRIFLGQSRGWLFEYGMALVNALVIGKVVLIADMAMRKPSENRPLIVHAVYKAFVYALLALLLHVVEIYVHNLVHGQGFFGAFQAVVEEERDEILARAVFFFFAFIPFCVLSEIRRALGPERFLQMIFVKGTASLAEKVSH